MPSSGKGNRNRTTIADLITLKEAAELSGLSYSHFRYLVWSGELRARDEIGLQLSKPSIITLLKTAEQDPSVRKETMAQLLDSAVDQAVGLLADRLIEVYQAEQVAAMVNEFAQAGFTRDSLIGNPVFLYRMLVIAAYDRWPFTIATGGYETIWEIEPGSIGVPTLMAQEGLWSITELATLNDDEIRVKLSKIKLGVQPMESDGSVTNYVKTLRTIASYANSGFVKRLQQTQTANEIRIVYHTFEKGIHGIGSTISSKLVKYLLREIHIGKARPANFPSDVAWPLMREWHASSAANKFNQLSPDLVPLTAKLIEQRGDAYAIDALFYLQRNRPRELDELIKNLRTL